MKKWLKKYWPWLLGGTALVGVALYLYVKGSDQGDGSIYDYEMLKDLETPVLYDGRNLTVKEVVALLGMDEWILQKFYDDGALPADIAASYVYDYVTDNSNLKDILEPIVYSEG